MKSEYISLHHYVLSRSLLQSLNFIFRNATQFPTTPQKILRFWDTLVYLIVGGAIKEGGLTFFFQIEEKGPS